MSKLYTEWAEIYDALYEQLFDYDAEHDYYSQVLNRHNCRSILEYGCGTGRLAQRLIQSGYDYVGVDLSEEMLNLARRRNPGALFFEGDLQTFQLENVLDSVLITGRTLSYLTTNAQALSAFRSIYRNLRPGGILAFDAVDADAVFSEFPENGETLEIVTERGLIRRESRQTALPEHGWTWEWKATYAIKEADQPERCLGTDTSILRAFLREELLLLLKISGFEFISTFTSAAYAWPSPFYVLRRVY